ncbi:hypothetical protein KFU94_44865 [Chloroflexi bacterium TSY]|nr:hypothetical protein [Chloroflexi bacterium TSY]
MQKRTSRIRNYRSRYMDSNRPAMCGVATDLARSWEEIMSAPPIQEWGRMWNDAFDAWNRAAEAVWEPAMQPRRYTCQCGCPDDCCCSDPCKYDDCHCQCCITDADLLIHARVGDRQMVPLVIENNRRRERDVELSISDWTTHKDQPVKINGRILDPDSFTLGACEERAVVLAIDVAGTDSTIDDTGAPANQQLPDVDSCKVYYADLRVKGCDIRSIRIAVAVLPRDCANHVIDCHCGCC